MFALWMRSGGVNKNFGAKPSARQPLRNFSTFSIFLKASLGAGLILVMALGLHRCEMQVETERRSGGT